MRKNIDASVSAVIVAAGKGTRMHMDISKQYAEILGRPVLAWALQAFEDCRAIGEIVLVVGNKDIVYCKQSIVDEYGFQKIKSIVAGGEERQHSVYNGLREVSSSCGIVLIHDGARPFVSEQSIMDGIQAAGRFDAASMAVPVKDTIKRADGEDMVAETLDRKVLWAIHTPQAFKYSRIMEAHRKAAEDGFSGTDDTVLTERLGIKTRLVMDSYSNIKITTPEDLVIAQAIAENPDIYL